MTMFTVFTSRASCGFDVRIEEGHNMQGVANWTEGIVGVKFLAFDEPERLPSCVVQVMPKERASIPEDVTMFEIGEMLFVRHPEKKWLRFFGTRP